MGFGVQEAFGLGPDQFSRLLFLECLGFIVCGSSSGHFLRVQSLRLCRSGLGVLIAKGASHNKNLPRPKPKKPCTLKPESLTLSPIEYYRILSSMMNAQADSSVSHVLLDEKIPARGISAASSTEASRSFFSLPVFLAPLQKLKP